MLRVMPGVLAVVALAGCDVVFGLAEPTDEGDQDAGVDPDGVVAPDAPLPPVSRCAQVGQMVELPLVADTYLRQGLTEPSGGAPIAYVVAGAVTLVRFDPGADAFDQLTVTLDHAAMSPACALNDVCAPCPLGVTGQITASFVRPDWDEQVATHELRATGQRWAAGGAAGTDRSAPAAVAPFGGAGLIVMNIPLAGNTSATWPPGLSLVFSVESAEGVSAASGLFHTREAPSSCGAPAPPRAVARCAAVSTAVCGNDVADPGEQCDDGNLIDGDGCSAFCALEGACGNGNLEAGEQCDDGNTIATDGCANCMLAPVPQ